MWLSCCFFQFHFFFAGDKCCVAVNWKRKKWWNNQHQTRQWSNTVLWYVIKIQWNLDKPHYSKQILTVPWAFVLWSSTVLWKLQKSRPIVYVCRDVAKSQLPATCNFTGWIELINALNCSRKSNTWAIVRRLWLQAAKISVKNACKISYWARKVMHIHAQSNG